jgi:FHS family L-fucose permease-like MFS transporter
MAVIFMKSRLPQVSEKIEPFSLAAAKQALRSTPLRLAVIGIFAYVGAEVSIGSFLVNYLTNVAHMTSTEHEAAKYVSIYWTGAMVGRFIGSAAMQKIEGNRALMFAAIMAALLVGASTITTGQTAGYALLAVGLFNSIMFPTIFALGVSGLGALTSVGSSLLVMAIVGGAILPVVVGGLADMSGLKAALALPALCYGYIAWFATKCGEDDGVSVVSREGRGSRARASVPH